MEPEVPLFVVKIADGSSLTLLQEALQEEHRRMEYIATSNFSIWVHHQYFHSQMMRDQGLTHDEVMVWGRLYPNPSTGVVGMDIKGGYLGEPYYISSGLEHLRTPEGEWDPFSPKNSEWKKEFRRREQEAMLQSSQILTTVALFLRTIDPTLRYWRGGKFIELPDY